VTSAPDLNGATTSLGVHGRPFRRLIAAWSVTTLGDGVRTAALPLYTAVITRSPLAVSAVAVAEVLPWLVVALPAGALVDRFPARRTLICAHAIRFAVLLLAGVLIHTGTGVLPTLVVCAFLLTGVETFADSAAQTMLVNLAGSNELERANSWFVSVETMGIEIVGPLLAAGVFAWQSDLWFLVNALVFGVAALCVAAVPYTAAAQVAQRSSDSLRFEVFAGIRFLVRNPSLRTIVGVVGLTALLISAVNAVAPLYAIDVLHLSAAAVPTLLVCLAIGTIIASSAVSRLSARLGGGVVMIAALLVLAVGTAVLGTVHLAPAAWAAYLVMGIGAGAWNVLSAANRQRLTPTAMMGRVTSAYRTLAWGLMPLGAGLAGPVAEVSSLGAVILGAAVLTAVVAFLAAPRLREL
jgi:MFS family permease